MSSKRNALIAIAVILFCSGFLFHPLLLSVFSKTSRFLEWDVPEQYWPDLSYLCQALHEGDFPLWNPYDRAGYPSYADPQAGSYHPVNWVICLLAGESPGLAWAEFRVVLGFLFAGLFTLLWLRRLKLPWGASLLGAVIFEAAPFMRHNFELNLTTALAYLPLMCWAADRAVVEQKLRDGIALALATALCAWVGSPPALFLSLVFTYLYATCRLLAQVKDRGAKVLTKGVANLALAVLLTTGLTAVIIVPGLSLTRESVQAGREFASIAEGALEPKDLLALVWPQEGNHLYVGLLVLLLSIFSMTFPVIGKLTKSPVVNLFSCKWFFFVMAIVSVILCLGENTPIFALVYHGLPGASLFRLPHRYEAWLGPCMAVLAAWGLTLLTSFASNAWMRNRQKQLRIVAVVLVGTGVASSFLGIGFGPSAGLMGIGIVALGVSIKKWGAAHIAVGSALSFLLLLDVSQTLPPDRHTVPGPGPASLSAEKAILDRTPDTQQGYRYMDEFGISCRSGTRLGRRDFRGYQDPLLLKGYERVLSSMSEAPRLAEQFNVRYVLTGPHFIHGWNRHFLPRPDLLLRIPGAQDLGAGVIELPKPLPAAYWVPLSQVENVPDRQTALSRIKQTAPSRVAILENASFSNLHTPTESVQTDAAVLLQVDAAHWTLDRDQLSFSIDAPDAGVIVVNEAFYPGWKALVDGANTPIFRANAQVRGIFVDKGSHSIQMEFAPWDGTALRWILLLTLVLCTAGMVLSFQLDRKELSRQVQEPQKNKDITDSV